MWETVVSALLDDYPLSPTSDVFIKNASFKLHIYSGVPLFDVFQFCLSGINLCNNGTMCKN